MTSSQVVSQHGSLLRASQAGAGLRNLICQNEVIQYSSGKCSRLRTWECPSESVFCQLLPETGMEELTAALLDLSAHESNQPVWMEESEVEWVASPRNRDTHEHSQSRRGGLGHPPPRV